MRAKTRPKDAPKAQGKENGGVQQPVKLPKGKMSKHAVETLQAEPPAAHGALTNERRRALAQHLKEVSPASTAAAQQESPPVNERRVILEEWSFAFNASRPLQLTGRVYNSAQAAPPRNGLVPSHTR